MSSSSTSLSRQTVIFLIVGAGQLMLDSVLYIGLTAVGLPVAPANLAGRLGGACLGYALNGRYTFAVGGETRLGRQAFLRFVVMWSSLTVLSTLILAWVASSAGLHGSWVAKPIVEALMAAIGFFVQRHWVFQK